jgi:hypothetical protein
LNLCLQLLELVLSRFAFHLQSQPFQSLFFDRPSGCALRNLSQVLTSAGMVSEAPSRCCAAE